MPDPGYPCNRNVVRLAGAEAQLVAVNAESNFQLNAGLLQRYCKDSTRGCLGGLTG